MKAGLVAIQRRSAFTNTLEGCGRFGGSPVLTLFSVGQDELIISRFIRRIEPRGAFELFDRAAEISRARQRLSQADSKLGRVGTSCHRFLKCRSCQVCVVPLPKDNSDVEMSVSEIGFLRHRRFELGQSNIFGSDVVAEREAEYEMRFGESRL